MLKSNGDTLSSWFRFFGKPWKRLKGQFHKDMELEEEDAGAERDSGSLLVRQSTDYGRNGHCRRYQNFTWSNVPTKCSVWWCVCDDGRTRARTWCCCWVTTVWKSCRWSLPCSWTSLHHRPPPAASTPDLSSTSTTTIGQFC